MDDAGIELQADDLDVEIEQRSPTCIAITINLKRVPGKRRARKVNKHGDNAKLTPREAAAFCGYKCVKSIYRALEKGVLPYERAGDGGHYLIDRNDLVKFMRPPERSEEDLHAFIAGQMRRDL